MRNASLITSTLFLTLFAIPGCKEEPAPNEPGEFGEPCLIGEEDNTPNGCASGLYCYFGYCEELCASNSDCQPVEGGEHICAMGKCNLACDASNPCPDSLAAQLSCNNGNRCEAEEFE